MNNLQRLDAERDYFVTLNLQRADRRREVIETIPYAHPVITHESVAAQRRWAEISGVDRIHYCGAYWRWGFHEDGCWSALRACDGVRRAAPAERRAGAGGVSASALYEGWVRHRRVDPVEHEFRYPIFMAYLDLSELPEVLDPLPRLVGATPGAGLVSALRPPRDRRSCPLDRVVRERVAARPARRPEGPIRMLTNLRYFGHCFNPVSFYFCFDESGSDGRGRARRGPQHSLGRAHAYVLGNDGRKRVVSGTTRRRSSTSHR